MEEQILELLRQCQPNSNDRANVTVNILAQEMGRIMLLLLSKHGLHFENKTEIQKDATIAPFWNLFEHMLWKHRKLTVPSNLKSVIRQECREALLSSLQTIDNINVTVSEPYQKFLQCIVEKVGKTPPKFQRHNDKLLMKLRIMRTAWEMFKGEVPKLLQRLRETNNADREFSEAQLDSLGVCVTALVDVFAGPMLDYVQKCVCFDCDKKLTATKWDEIN